MQPAPEETIGYMRPISPELLVPKRAGKAGEPVAPEPFTDPFIVAAVIWYRQTPERLERMVRSLEGRAHGIVALDGPFRGLSREPSSPVDNYETISRTAEACGLWCEIYEGQEWGGEPEKRTAAARAALELARAYAPDQEPWVLVLDSDEWLETDIDADTVRRYGWGSGLMQAYRAGERTAEGGTGAKMVRLMPNTEHLIWGPAHFDVRDMSIPQTYLGWEKELHNEDDPAFTIGHDLGEKVIQAEYEAYNDVRRVEAEGKSMRVIPQDRDDLVTIRMDNEQLQTGGWTRDKVIRVAGAVVGKGGTETVFVRIAKIVPVAGAEGVVSDIVCEVVDEKRAEELSKVMVEAEREKHALAMALLERRAAKRARQVARHNRRYGR